MAVEKVLCLKEHPEYKSSLIELLSQHFSKGAEMPPNFPFEKEFPLLLDPENAAHVFFIMDGDRVVSTASYRLFQMKVPPSIVPLTVAALGLVVTHPEAERKGYASQIQKVVEESAVKEGAAIMMLWSTLQDFYAKRAYLIAGSEYKWILKKENLSAEHTKGTLKQIKNISDVAPLYEKMNLGPARKYSLYQSFTEIPETHLWGVYEGEKLQAYAFWGKGRDLRGVLHEIAGDTKYFTQLFTKALEKQETMELSYPAWTSARKEIEKILGPGELNAYSFMKALIPGALADWMNRSGTLPPEVKIRWGMKGLQIFEKDDLIFQSEWGVHFIQLFFGPLPISHIKDAPANLKKLFENFEPYSLYFWGFDGV